MFGQIVDDFDTRQFGRQRFALATDFRGADNLFFSLVGDWRSKTFRFIKGGSCGVAASTHCSDLRPNSR